MITFLFNNFLQKNISRLGFQNSSCVCETRPKLFFEVQQKER